jgi:hypothetical protein
VHCDILALGLVEMKAKSQIFNLRFLKNFRNSISGRLSLNKSRRGKEKTQVLVRKRGAEIPANGSNLYLGNLAVNSNTKLYVAQFLHIIPCDTICLYIFYLRISVPRFRQERSVFDLFIAMNSKTNRRFRCITTTFYIIQ